MALNESDKHLKTYEVILSLLNNEVMLNWQRANISLLGHSILILAWATIYATNGKDNRGILAAILVFGGILCILWFRATLSGNTYHSEWQAWLSHLESQLSLKQNEGSGLLSNVWDKHDQLLQKREIELGSKKVKLSRLALGVKDYFKGLPILFIAIYSSLLVYLWYPSSFRISIKLILLGFGVWFIWIPFRDWKDRLKNKNGSSKFCVGKISV